MANDQPDISASRWINTKELFARASELPREQWLDFLSSASDDLEIRAEVYRLLSSSDPATGFFNLLAKDIGTVTQVTPRMSAGQVLNGRFKVIGFLARGGMGEVYEAEDLELGGHVALKTMRAAVAGRGDSLQRFRDEIRLARTINSPYVCRVYDVARDGDLLYFSMELLNGQTLADRIGQHGPLPIAEAKPLIRQMALGLDAAHQVGVLHRDFKTSNVMLSHGASGPRAVITDFGLCRALDRNPAGAFEGATPAFVAPEQLQGESETSQTDLYSFGVVLFETMTGQLPFGEIPSLEAARAHLGSAPESPRRLRPELPDEWEEAILKCLDRDPSKRFRSAPEVSKALGCDGPPRSTRRVWITAALASIPAVAAASWYASRSKPTALAPSIAVLPFESSDESNQYIADGIADRLTDSLTKLPGLRVISRAAAQRFKDASRRPAAAGEQLRVRYLFSGKVTVAGNRLHVASEIVEAATGFQTWAGTEDRDVSQAELIGTSLSRAAIHALKLEAHPAELSEMSRRLTNNAEAYHLFMLGRYHASRRSADALAESVKVLERAVALDPSFSAGWAALGYSYFDLGIRSGRNWNEPMTRALAAARKALAIDAVSAEGFMVSGAVKHWYLWDWQGAIADFRESIRSPSRTANAHRQYAVSLMYLQNFSEALDQTEQAMLLDPLNPSIAVLKGTVLAHSGRFDEAERLYREVVASDPAYENVYVPLADLLEQKGLLADAIAAAERAVSISQQASFALSCVARLYGLAKRTSEAKTLLDELLARHRANRATAGEVAPVYAGLGDVNQTLNWLERGVSEHTAELVELRISHQYKDLRSNPRFAGLLARMRL